MHLKNYSLVKSSNDNNLCTNTAKTKNTCNYYGDFFDGPTSDQGIIVHNYVIQQVFDSTTIRPRPSEV